MCRSHRITFLRCRHTFKHKNDCSFYWETTRFEKFLTHIGCFSTRPCRKTRVAGSVNSYCPNCSETVSVESSDQFRAVSQNRRVPRLLLSVINTVRPYRGGVPHLTDYESSTTSSEDPFQCYPVRPQEPPSNRQQASSQPPSQDVNEILPSPHQNPQTLQISQATQLEARYERILDPHPEVHNSATRASLLSYTQPGGISSFEHELMMLEDDYDAKEREEATARGRRGAISGPSGPNVAQPATCSTTSVEGGGTVEYLSRV